MTSVTFTKHRLLLDEETEVPGTTEGFLAEIYRPASFGVSESEFLL